MYVHECICTAACVRAAYNIARTLYIRVKNVSALAIFFIIRSLFCLVVGVYSLGQSVVRIQNIYFITSTSIA